MHRHAVDRRWRAFAALGITVLQVHEIRILPPATDLPRFHVALDDIAMVALRSCQGNLAIDSSKNVIVTDVAIVRAGQ